jgi:hypothetical protein
VLIRRTLPSSWNRQAAAPHARTRSRGLDGKVKLGSRNFLLPFHQAADHSVSAEMSTGIYFCGIGLVLPPKLYSSFTEEEVASRPVLLVILPYPHLDRNFVRTSSGTLPDPPCGAKIQLRGNNPGGVGIQVGRATLWHFY